MEAMPDSRQQPPATAAQAARSCFHAFEGQLQHASGENPRLLSLVMDQQARFSVWAANIRAFGSGRASLDHRLREAPDVRDAIVGLMETLKYHIESLGSQSAPPSDTAEAAAPPAPAGSLDQRAVESLGQIAAQITLLHKFSNVIRKASRETKNPNAARYFRMLDEDGNDMETSLYAAFDHYVHDRFPKLDESMRRRLADAMILQRKRVLYRRSRYGTKSIEVPTVPSQPTSRGLELEMAASAITPEQPSPQPIPDTAPMPLSRSAVVSMAQTATTLVMDAYRKVSTPSTVSASRTVATDKHEKLIYPPAPRGILRVKYDQIRKQRQERDTRDFQGLVIRGISDYADSNKNKTWQNYAAAAAATAAPLAKEVLSVMPPDRVLQEKPVPQPTADLCESQTPDTAARRAQDWAAAAAAVGEITCPFCFHALPVEDVTDQKRWERHVLVDLDPYVCLFTDCDTCGELYSHSDTWLRHMSQHAVRWRCKAKNHAPYMTASRDEYLSHMKAEHLGKFTDPQLEMLAETNGRSSGRLFDTCPLCGEGSVEGKMEDHVIGHLRLLGLKALPTYQDDGPDDASSSDGASQNRSNSRTRSTLLDAWETPSQDPDDGGDDDASHIPESSSPPGANPPRSDPVEILGIEMVIPKPHFCSKGEKCSKYKKRQRIISEFLKQYPDADMGSDSITISSEPAIVRDFGDQPRDSEWGLILSWNESLATQQDDPVIQHIRAHGQQTVQDDVGQRSSDDELGDDMQGLDTDGPKPSLPATLEGTDPTLGELSDLHQKSHALLLERALEDLKSRVDDNKDYTIESLGKLLMHGVYPLSSRLKTWDKRKDYFVYLFEDSLLCCKEVDPSGRKHTLGKTKKTTPTVPATSDAAPKLERRGRIYMASIRDVFSLTSPEPHTLQIWWWRSDKESIECLMIKFPDEETIVKWASVLEARPVSTSPGVSQGADPDPDPGPSSSRHTAPAARSPDMGATSKRWAASSLPAVAPPRSPLGTGYSSRIEDWISSRQVQPPPIEPPPPAAPSHVLRPPPPGPGAVARVQLAGSTTHYTLEIAFNASYKELMDQICEHAVFKADRLFQRGGIKVQYRDDDGDWVTIEDDDDVNMALVDSRLSREVNLMVTQAVYRLGRRGSMYVAAQTAP